MLSIKSLIECLDAQARCVMEKIAQHAQQRAHVYVTPYHLAYEVSDGLSHQNKSWLEVKVNAADFLKRMPSKLGQSPVMSTELIDLLAESHRLSIGKISCTTLVHAWLNLRHLPHELTHLKPLLEQTINSMPTAIGQPQKPQKHEEMPIGSDIPDTLKHVLSDLTQQAKLGGLDPVIGRDQEIQQVLEILSRRRQNNPILVGEPGVGKTAVVEGLAQKIVDSQMPASLKEARLLSLDINGLQAGVSAKGALQERLRQLIDYVRTSPGATLLFVDEAHMLMGSHSGNAGSEVANALKPALARGELRMIAATTWSEYKQYFESDAALARRFQLLRIEEPSLQNTIDMLSVLAPTLSKHHGVCIHPEAIHSAVELSHRYISGRQLPDKAINLLDTACAKVASMNTANTNNDNALRAKAWVTECQLTTARQSGLSTEQDIQALEQLAESISKEQTSLTNNAQNVNSLREQLKITASKLQEARSNNFAKLERIELEESYRTLRQQLYSNDITLEEVDSLLVAKVVTELTGIPTGAMQRTEQQILLNLAAQLNEDVIGQTHAMQRIADALLISNMQLSKSSRPRAVILLTGPSGTGKTATARSLAKHVFGSERALIRIQLSEFQEAHSVASLRGAPPGYVGYGRGGVLTEAVRKQPYSLVLLDEAEKAHPDVLEVFYQMFDRGEMDDAEGRTIDFKNTVILLTSNVGASTIEQQIALTNHSDKEITPELLNALIQPELLATFKAALLGRMTVIPFLTLSNASIKILITHRINELIQAIGRQNGAMLTIDECVINFLCTCSVSVTGARELDRMVQQYLTGPIARIFANQSSAKSVSVCLQEGFPVVTYAHAEHL